MHLVTWNIWSTGVLRVAAEAWLTQPAIPCEGGSFLKGKLQVSNLRARVFVLSTALKAPHVGFISPLPVLSLVTFSLLCASPRFLQQAGRGNCVTYREAI